MTDQFLFGRTYVDGSWRVAVGLVGRKHIQAVYIADGNFARVQKLPNDRDHIAAFRPLFEYPSLQKLAGAILRGRKVSQMTTTARDILTRAKQAGE
jgi:hypothetical protein